MKDLETELKAYHSRDLEQRKRWYASVANDYDRARPNYPEALIDRALDWAKLPANAGLLEIGCGPGKATVSFAKRGFPIVCLEPNQVFCQLARQNCAPYANVEILNVSFEEWPLEVRTFDGVLAANAFHWIPPEIAYQKAARTLKDEGWLMLFWNMTPEPSDKAYAILRDVYERYAPTLVKYEGQETQTKIQQELGQTIVNSGHFKDLLCHQIFCKVTYGGEDYLMLLNTFSPYRSLAAEAKEALFAGLRETIETQFDGSLHLSYLSAFHLARKQRDSGV